MQLQTPICVQIAKNLCLNHFSYVFKQLTLLSLAVLEGRRRAGPLGRRGDAEAGLGARGDDVPAAAAFEGPRDESGRHWRDGGEVRFGDARGAHCGAARGERVL